MILARTQRLTLSQFSEADADGFYRMNLDPEVIRYTGDAPFATEADALAFIRDYDQYRLYGFGRWALHLEGEFIGFCGLKKHLSGEVDLGVRLVRHHWGMGLAWEAATAAMVLARDRFGLSHVISRAMDANQASLTLLKRLGFCRFTPLDSPPWVGFEAQLDTPAMATNLAAWRRTVTLMP